mgnify:FL=1|jgi:hypothetical protein
MHIILTGRLSASFPCLASLRQHTQACCEPVKITAKFQWFWILYYFVFLIYTDGYSNHHGVYVIRYWLLIFVFMNGDL